MKKINFDIKNAQRGYYSNADKNRIIDYLRGGDVLYVSPGVGIDEIDNTKSIKLRKEGHTDGTFEWLGELAYYVEKYNIRVPEEFEKHIFNNI